MLKSPLCVLLLALAEAWSLSSQDLFEPQLEWRDSVSIRQRLASEGLDTRTDYFVRTKTANGLPVRIEGLSTDDSGTYTSTYEYTWDEKSPVGAGLRRWFAPLRFVHTYSLNGSLRASDTMWSVWNPTQRIQITTVSPPNKACRWNDSSVFDARNRLIFQKSCEGAYTDPEPYFSTFRAWYEHETDSMPRWASTRGGTDGRESHFDSMFSIGPANHPDSLLGTMPALLIWDAQGHLLAHRMLKSPEETLEYSYDLSGRLIRAIRNALSTNPDTTLFVYSWEPTSIRRPPAARSLSLHLAAQGLAIDLPAPARIRIEVIGPDGARRAPTLTKSLPAGRTILPVFLPPGSLVRVRSSQGGSALLIPVQP